MKKPYLIWAGKKDKQAPGILSLLPNGKRLIEPFAGSCALGLASPYGEIIAADNNPDLIMLHKMIRDDVESVIAQARPLFAKGGNNPTVFYKRRDTFNGSNDPAERAILFLYMNRSCHRGLCRYNLKGGFNCPFGWRPRLDLPEDEIRAFSGWAKSATFQAGDFRQTMASAGAGDVVYNDPPYWPRSATASFTAYNGRTFAEPEQIALADAARSAAQRGAFVAISNNDLPETRELYQGATLHTFEGSRKIGNGKGENKAAELIAVFN